MQVRQLPAGKIIAIVLGLGLIIAMIASEILSTSPNGIGPYQAILILLGLLIMLLGIFPSEHWTSKVVLASLSVVVTLILIEGVLLILSRSNVTVTFPNTQELLNDEILGKRTPPSAVGHDSRGWRNETALEQADIVTIGDSQTWGVNVILSETYPSVLSQLTDYSVYNMAQGSYGAVQYRVLTEQAVELSPQLIVIGMYFGNDFADAYSIVYGDYAHQELRDPNFDFAFVSQSIAEQAVEFRPERLRIEGQQIESDNSSDLTLLQRVQSGTYIGKFLTSAGVFDAINTGESEQQFVSNRNLVSQYSDYFDIYESENVRTLFTPAYRQLVVNIESPIIQEGLRISKHQYAEIQNLVESANVELLIVLIPTKEMIYAPYLNELNTAHMTLVAQETHIRSEMTAFFDENEIAYVDILPAMQNAVEEDIAIYPQTFDGHPNDNGYRIIAQVIADYIAENEIMK